MKDLYLALWGKELPIVQDFRIQVPQADNGIRPGYKITMRPSASGKTFAPPQFMSKAKEEVFKIIEVGASCHVECRSFSFVQSMKRHASVSSVQSKQSGLEPATTLRIQEYVQG